MIGRRAVDICKVTVRKMSSHSCTCHETRLLGLIFRNNPPARRKESSQTTKARKPTKGREFEDWVKIQRMGAKAIRRSPSKARKQRYAAEIPFKRRGEFARQEKT